MVPHSIVTVSLATAMLPRLSARAADGRPGRPGAARWRRRCARAGAGHAVRRAAAGDRHRRWPGWSSATAPAGDDYDCYAPDAGPLRHRAGLLHRPLPHAARLLRPGAEPHRVLHPVRRVGRPTSWSRWCWCAAPADGGTAPALVRRLRRVVRRRRAAVLRRAAARARRARAPPAWSGSWSGCAVAAALAGRRGLAVERAAAGLAGRPGRWWRCCGVVRRRGRRRSSCSSARRGCCGSRRSPRWSTRSRVGCGSAAPLRRPTMAQGQRAVADLTADEGSECRARSGPATSSPTATASTTCSAESGGGRFWRAHDRVLRAPRGPARARRRRRAGRPRCSTRPARSATVVDRADAAGARRRARPTGSCYVVNEWGQGDSLDIVLAREGPLPPRRAAWLVAEVADAWRPPTPRGGPRPARPRERADRPGRRGPGHRLRASTPPCTACRPGRRASTTSATSAGCSTPP